MFHDNPAGPARHSGKQKITLIVLGVAALATVFLLPRLVSGPWLLGGLSEQPGPVESPAPEVSPSTAAEKTKYRQDSQTMLAQVVSIRDRLRAQNVETWGEIEFGQALAAVQAGDELYSYGEYRASLDSYRQALDGLTQLEARGQQLLAEALADGLQAVEDLNPNVAQKSVGLATAIAPDNSEVRTLVSRADILPEVAALLEEGDRARSRGELESARTAYQRAADLDPAHRRAGEALTSIGVDITDSRFRAHMSRGYRLLEQGDYEGARSAFSAAGEVHPGHAAVAGGLSQLENRRSQDRVNAQMREAAELEAGEEWHQALGVYEALLDQDPSLTQAKVRLIPARVRADLDSRLQAFIEKPLSLASPSGYRDGQRALGDARGIANPGPRLAAQITEMEELLVDAVAVVDVVFQSDNLTHVTLFRVVELGQFDQTSVKLRPGHYVAAGKRSGFRDVRVEFTVTGKPLDGPIVVRCEDPI